jgi:light-regulated signal transduction histidine kinase (bacteriophytochrome)
MAFDTVNMQLMVQEVVGEMVDVKERNAQLKIGELPKVKADESLIRQVWINLISNALKYSSRGQVPEIQIRAVQKGDWYEFSVSDNGVGFDMSYAGKLFGVFQRLHNDNEFEGTGIGLALVARIVKRHGGRIWADARPGEGATFTFTLPIT